MFLKWITKQVQDLKCSTKQRPASDLPGNTQSAGNTLAGGGVGSTLEPAGMPQITLHQCWTKPVGFNVAAITLHPLASVPQYHPICFISV